MDYKNENEKVSLDELIDALNGLDEIDPPENFHLELMRKIVKIENKPTSIPFDWRMFSNIAAVFIVTLMLFGAVTVGIDLLAGKPSADSAETQAPAIAGMSLTLENGGAGLSVTDGSAESLTEKQADIQAAASPSLLVGQATPPPPGMAKSFALADAASSEGKNVKSYDITIEVENFDNAVQSIGTIGGSTITSRIDRNGDGTGYASFAQAVPDEQFYGVVSALKNLGEVKNESQGQYSVLVDAKDAYAHYNVKFEEKNRLMELLSKTTNVENMLTVERRLNAVIDELEDYKNQINRWNSIANSPTINITLMEKQKPAIFVVKTAPFSETVRNTFIASVNATVAAAKGIVLLVSYLSVPCLVIGAFLLVILGVRWIFRR